VETEASGCRTFVIYFQTISSCEVCKWLSIFFFSSARSGLPNRLAYAYRHGQRRRHSYDTIREPDFSYRGRFVPWIFCTLRNTDYSYHSRTFRAIAEQ